MSYFDTPTSSPSGSFDSGRGASVGPSSSTASTADSSGYGVGATLGSLGADLQSAQTQATGALTDWGNQASQYGDQARSAISGTIADARQASASALAQAGQMGDQLSAYAPDTNRLGSQLQSTIMGAGIVSKLLFLIVVVISFFLLVTIGTSIIVGLTAYSKDPMLLRNLKSGTEQVIVAGDPRTPGSIPLLRSKNQGPGIEFTYSTWIYVDELPTPKSLPSPVKYRHVFHKGTAGDFSADGLSQPVNSPGLYIASSAADSGRQSVDLYVVMSTFEDPMETLTISDAPLDKWLNVIIVVKGQVLDVYVNGTIAGRSILKGVPLQSYGPLNMSLNGGFSGKMSSTQYFSYALSPVQIANVAAVHPSLKEKGGVANTFPPYLSLRWYTGSGAI